MATTPVTPTMVFLNILDNYDQRLRPNFKGPPVQVYCSAYINSISSISEESMDYTVMLFLRQRWNDPRFVYQDYNDSITLYEKVLDKIWVPDIYFVNEKGAPFESTSGHSTLLRIHPNGDVLYSAKKTILLACPMNFQLFPMDNQVCKIKMESYGHTTKDIEIWWSREDAVLISEEIQMPDYDLVTWKINNNCDSHHTTGTYSCIEAKLFLIRHIGYYLIQHYIPSILIVVLSWLSFWISPEIAPARVALGITTVLTSTTLTAVSRSAMPRFSYVRAIDVWMMTCGLFIFFALVEFAVVHFIFKRDKKFAISRKAREMSKRLPRKKKAIDKKDVASEDEVDFKPDKGMSSPEPDQDMVGAEEKTHRTPAEIKALYMRRARRIDYYSRLIFPLLFTVFNILYWSVYLSMYH
ncbi:glycine receptor subunit alphaZ1-like isoform X2 [Branchiostoma floridae]|uniref:Glycine receptor subunit alphaZ1-like isoform X2 n=1 Tax=Branchiostoma floridae TaxID=7739 RepID=A0A9J7N6W6_BRAFL|nr:glycine receptor subunit alphaZ1-like isoform X2 [Branchiostoma floridae]